MSWIQARLWPLAVLDLPAWPQNLLKIILPTQSLLHSDTDWGGLERCHVRRDPGVRRCQGER